MDIMQKTVDQMRLHQKNDESFIKEISLLAEQKGDAVYQASMQVLTSLDLSEETAKLYWQEALEHRDQLSQTTGRKIELITAVSDYLSHVIDRSYTPRLIDSALYTNVLHDSVIDKLTALNNRAYFDQTFEQQLSLARRYNTDLSLLFIDIDNFKEINDRFGHQAGDAALKQVAEIVTYNKRDSDIAARFGGEEFTLLMPHTGSINGLILGERIREAVAKSTFIADNNTFSMTISGGLASYPLHGRSTAEIIAIADQAVYQAKGAGKNLISVFKKDKRRYLRVKFSHPVIVKELEIEATSTHTGIGQNICIGGVLFKSSEALTIGSKIQIHTKIKKDAPLLLIGTVVRVEAFGPNEYDIGVAISFKEMEKIARDEIAGLLRAEN